MKIIRLHKFIAITLCVTLLTISASRVTRVSAVGTTIAAAAGATLCAVGIAYCSYMVLTGASIHVPDAVSNIHEWLKDVGSKVVQFPSGREAYNELYPRMLQDPTAALLHDFLDSEVWTWSADKLKAWANDFSNKDVISNILSYEAVESAAGNYLYNSFDYAGTFTVVNVPHIVYTYSNKTFETLVSEGYVIEPYSGYHYIFALSDGVSVEATDLVGEYRNYFDGSKYKIQQYVNGEWTDVSVSFHFGYECYTNSNQHKSLRPFINGAYYDSYDYTSPVSTITISSGSEFTYPPLTDLVIYDAVNDVNLPLNVPETLTRYSPQWPTLSDEDNNKPVIPYVEVPYDPNYVPSGGGTPGGGNWGFNLGQLLDALEELAGLMMEIGVLGELINQFRDLLGNDNSYYIYYDDSENNQNYYDYHTITNFGDNYSYNTDIDVSDADEHLPVDLNSIVTYTDNRYLDEVKRSATAGSSIIRDLVVFWYDVDPIIVYIFFGSCIAILVAAFIGKWGHS